MVFLGAAVSVKMTCNSGHDESWHSSRTVGQGRWTMPLINLVMVVYCFMTGLQFDRVKVCIFWVCFGAAPYKGRVFRPSLIGVKSFPFHLVRTIAT